MAGSSKTLNRWYVFLIQYVSVMSFINIYTYISVCVCWHTKKSRFVLDKPVLVWASDSKCIWNPLSCRWEPRFRRSGQADPMVSSSTAFRNHPKLCVSTDPLPTWPGHQELQVSCKNGDDWQIRNLDSGVPNPHWTRHTKSIEPDFEKADVKVFEHWVLPPGYRPFQIPLVSLLIATI